MWLSQWIVWALELWQVWLLHYLLQTSMKLGWINWRYSSFFTVLHFYQQPCVTAHNAHVCAQLGPLPWQAARACQVCLQIFSPCSSSFIFNFGLMILRLGSYHGPCFDSLSVLATTFQLHFVNRYSRFPCSLPFARKYLRAASLKWNPPEVEEKNVRAIGIFDSSAT